MKEPVLVIMAAGMGSRYGGLKQIDPIDENGHLIIDFSIYDAIKAGFKKIIFIIKREIEDDIRSVIDKNISKNVKVEYVYQDLSFLPEGYKVPDGRIKPWGTGHAVLSCINRIEGSFAVINADDYYGPLAFHMVYNYLTEVSDDNYYQYTMAGYILEHTLTENGHVARGVCDTADDDYLVNIAERTRIEKRPQGAAYTEDDGKTWIPIKPNCIVSMNMWGFNDSILKELKLRFPEFLNIQAKNNPMGAEFFLPNVVGELIKEGRAKVKVLKTNDHWYGVTYKEDKPVVTEAINRLQKNGLYPNKLWE